MKHKKKVDKKISRRMKDYDDLMNATKRGRTVYIGQYTMAGSRNLKKQG